MKIENIDSILAGNSHIVRITTDQGIDGIGQSGCWGYMEATDSIVKKFKDYLIGKDPLDIEHHWQYLYRMGPFRGSVINGALSAVDIALWDIKYYKGLGTNTRDEAKDIFKDVVKNTIQYTWNNKSQQALLLAFLKENSDDLKKRYEKEQFKYRTPQMVQARQILRRLARDASDAEFAKESTFLKQLQEQIAQGADFAALAKEHSQDETSASKGGDLGLIKRGQTIKPLENEIFSLKTNELSKEAQKGFFLSESSFSLSPPFSPIIFSSSFFSFSKFI